MSGDLALRVVPRAPELLLNPIAKSDLAERLRFWTPRTDLGRSIREAIRYLPAELAHELLDRVQRIVIVQSKLEGVLLRPGRAPEYLGILSEKLITDAGVAYLASCFDNTAEPENFKYHGYGTGTTAEAAGDTALVTELTTEYAVNSTRPTGTNNHSSNTFSSVATLSPDSGGTLAITEHGLFSASSAGTLWDRSKFAAVNLVAASDSLETTYTGTLTSGG